MKKLLIAAALAGQFAVAPAQAAEMMACDDANIMKTEEAIKMSTDKAKMEMAMKEFDMAKTAMKDSKAEECSMHLTKAAEEVMVK